MSRRVNIPADRAAQNQATLKALLKLETNKVCADCKRNKHPRWASWNLGVFVCIRCSGIHRGMGTHISRVKSVDLDSWTDEQLQSILKWGNSRANKYWEAKLAPGHQPSEAKIENFIRTKYESKRWVMDGPMPDPATLDADGDDDVPLNIVQEKAKIERSASQRVASTSQQVQPPLARQPAVNVDLFGDDSPAAPPVRPNTADIPQNRPTRVGAAPPPPKAKQGDSLLGLDFFGGSQSTNASRPSSAASNPLATNTNSRPDLKQSILSLYASAPKQQSQGATHNRQPSFGGTASTAAPPHDPFSGLSNDLSGLRFSPTTSQQPAPKPTTSAFSAFDSHPTSPPIKATPAAPQVTSPAPLSGGSFFDNAPLKPTSQPKPPSAHVPSSSNVLNFAFTQPSTQPSKPAVPSAASDLFASDDFSGFASASPTLPAAPPSTQVSSPSVTNKTNFNSAFNLSSPATSAPTPTPTPAKSPAVTLSNSALFDPWSSGGDSNDWSAPEAALVRAARPPVQLGKLPAHITPNDIQGGWGAPISSSSKSTQPPAVTADEDFGGWTSASTTQTPATGPPKPSGGFGSASDPFANPWG